MNGGDIAEAITLYQYSATARSSARGQAVVRTLGDLYRRHEIGFHDLGPPTLHGNWQRRAGDDLQVNINYIDRLPAAMRLGGLSLLLVHEATHATVAFPSLYSEMAARLLSIGYFQELSGPGVFNEANDPPRPGQPSSIVHIAPGSFPEFGRMSEALRKDQLIDYILSIPDYTGPGYITPRWIVDNLTNWRGLRNRWPKTRGLYIRLLADSRDLYFNRAIIDIMESIEHRPDWDTMMGAAGSLRSIQLALDDLSAQPQYGGRIVALERRWGAHLLEEIPRM